jgi:hypothetical protein
MKGRDRAIGTGAYESLTPTNAYHKYVEGPLYQVIRLSGNKLVSPFIRQGSFYTLGGKRVVSAGTASVFPLFIYPLSFYQWIHCSLIILTAGTRLELVPPCIHMGTLGIEPSSLHAAR